MANKHDWVPMQGGNTAKRCRRCGLLAYRSTQGWSYQRDLKPVEKQECVGVCGFKWKVTGMQFPSGKSTSSTDRCNLPKGHDGPHKHFCGIDYLSKQEIWSFAPEEKVEKCIECGAEIPDIKAPKEITGSLICKKCAEKEGLPTLMNQLGLRLKCEEEKE